MMRKLDFSKKSGLKIDQVVPREAGGRIESGGK